jgi:hypothetical protein
MKDERIGEHTVQETAQAVGAIEYDEKRNRRDWCDRAPACGRDRQANEATALYHTRLLPLHLAIAEYSPSG